MGFWTNLIIVVHVVVALAIIGLVLLQHGKGADMGSGFGGGASSSLFGATGSANFLSRATAVLATAFFILSLALAYLATSQPRVPPKTSSTPGSTGRMVPTSPAMTRIKAATWMRAVSMDVKFSHERRA